MKKDYRSDFEEFCIGKNVEPPVDADHFITSFVHKDLSPSLFSVSWKLITVQGIVGVLTMFFCPQFEFSFTSSDELFHFFHRIFGLYGCMAICGAIFLGSGALVAGGILRLSEVELIQKSKFLFSFSTGGVALIAFLVLGADIYLKLAFVWMLGGAFASTVFLSGLFQVRRYFVHNMEL